MIVVDGRQSDKKISNFSNLEELLASLMEDESMNGRVVTDVLVNNENFSEIYPHQAEDMSCDGITSIEVRSEPISKMAVKMSGELEKVAAMMISGARNVSRLFREGQDADALELFQDLLDVTRDFMGMLAHLRDHYLGGADEEFVRRTENFSNLLSEMSEVLENEDWAVLSDILEYEFTPLCEEWKEVGAKMHHQIETAIQ